MDFSTQKSYTMWRRTGLISFWEKFKSMSLPTNWMNYTFYNWHNEECWWLWWLILCTQLVRLWYPALLTIPKPLTVWIRTDWKSLKEMGTLDHLTYLLRNLYAGQEATVRTGHGITDWFQQYWKGVPQACILSPWFFNFYAKCIV